MKESLLTATCPKTGKECSVRGSLVQRRQAAATYIAENYKPSLSDDDNDLKRLADESFARDTLGDLLEDQDVNCTKDRCVVLARVVDLSIAPPATAT